MTAVLASVVATADEPIGVETLLDEMTDLAGHAEFPAPAFTCRQASSYDRQSTSPADPETWFANVDFSHFVRDETIDGRTEHVLMDEAGPGAVVRIWSAAPFETMRVLDKIGEVGPQRIDGCSSKAHLWWRPAQDQGRLTLAFDAPRAGRFKVIGRFVQASNYGIVQLHVNGGEGGRSDRLLRPDGDRVQGARVGHVRTEAQRQQTDGDGDRGQPQGPPGVDVRTGLPPPGAGGVGVLAARASVEARRSLGQAGEAYSSTGEKSS